ncbi:type IA DNA topoisomerase [Aquibacillus halophilus]|uniref:DNA topoisomerase n=1 Tax=Aquibacillus halophilus TaxID=930132 RepID=A0A6A8D7Q5_9BACI|nr:type IA DNA topoisomerase [Aquibacillus halophilus]MRH41785.1 type IA DNA topoisomerase [Aquibacillus halophilus]
MRLIIAEKPSVAKNIADALKIKTKKDGYFEGNNYLITWAFGHLLQLFDAKDYDSKMASWKMDNFPFIPPKFQYKVKSSPRSKGRVDSGAYKQLKTIQSLIKRNDVDMIISACDYDREGQLIGDSIIEYQKVKKPVYRLLLNEWTQAEVLQGIEKMKSNDEMKPLKDAGISRQWADWVIGINLTSVATLKYQKGKGKALNIGRVLLPTLKIIYDRDKEIEQFKPENYFKLTATFQTTEGKDYQGSYTENDQEKFKKKENLEEIAKDIENKEAMIVDKQIERKKDFPPFLFNLSNLQGFITSKYKGWTSDKVLKVAQTLYEKKFITYPRTSSVALEESLVAKTASVLKALTENFVYKDEVKFIKSKRVFNNAKVESHSAIIPTYVLPNRLTMDEETVYSAIKNRFIAQFMPIAEHEETKLTTKIVDAELVTGVFISKGKVQLVEGWKKVEKIQSKDTLLPQVQVNDHVQLLEYEISSHATKPPKYHTEKTLLRVMETCGKGYKEDDVEEVLTGFSIGTPATRADTMKKLKDVGYITSESRNLLCTDLGKKLVETFPIKDLFDLEFTGRLEKSLADIEKEQVNKDDFLRLVFSFTSKSVQTIKGDADVTINQLSTEQNSITKEVLGKCPACGNSIIEGVKGFGCSNWKQGCKFVVWKNDKFLGAMKKKATKSMVKMLLKDNVAHVKGLTSKKGNKFDAYLRYEKNPANDYYSWKMEFKK